jgi:nucleolar protein 14
MAKSQAIKRAKEQAKKQTINPFELKINKQKYSVLNKKQKGQSGRPGLLRQKSETIRREQFALEKINRANIVLDKRIGEFGENKEDAMLKRFMKLKSKQLKNFNLEDDDDVELTHLGQKLDDFNDAGLELVSDGEDVDEEMVKHTHFGGFEEDGRKKSRNEIMKEIIQKSKQHKRERQMQKEFDLNMQEELDKDLDEIRILLAPISEGKMTVNNERLRMLAGESVEDISAEKERLRKDSEYDQIVREMLYDKRAKPTDRIKSEEELAKEAFEKLAAAEEDRIKRMNKTQEQEDEKTPVETRNTVADDLDDSYYQEQSDSDEEIAPLTYKDGILVNEKIFMKHHGQIDSSDGELDDTNMSDSSSSSEEESSKDSEIVKNEDCLNEDCLIEESDIDEHTELLKSMHEQDSIKEKKSLPFVKAKAATDELPYTFDAPCNYEEFQALIENRSFEDHELIVKRLRIQYNVKLGPENRPKMLKLMKILLRHILTLGSQSPMGIEGMKVVQEHYIALCRQFPIIFSKWCHARLIYLRDKLNSGLLKRISTFPEPGDLFIFRDLAR